MPYASNTEVATLFRAREILLRANRGLEMSRLSLDDVRTEAIKAIGVPSGNTTAASLMAKTNPAEPLTAYQALELLEKRVMSDLDNVAARVEKPARASAQTSPA